MRVNRTAGLILLMIGCFTVGAFAASNIEKVEAFLRKDYQVYKDGDKVDVGPVLIYNNVSYLPLSRVGELVGADVIWNAEDKGIYVNSRFAGQPENPNVSDQEYEQIRLLQAFGYIGQYKGGTYPVLMNMTLDGNMYYRDIDIQRMGINTNGLKKVKEEITGALFILESEVASVWDEPIGLYYPSEPVITGENNPAKIEVIKEYIDYLPDRLQFLNRDNPDFVYYIPQILVVDAQGENLYYILSYERETFVRYELTLGQNKDGSWRETQSKTIHLE